MCAHSRLVSRLNLSSWSYVHVHVQVSRLFVSRLFVSRLRSRRLQYADVSVDVSHVFMKISPLTLRPRFLSTCVEMI